MTRRRAGIIASSPVLVGAITTLIVILAVFLAYNANQGLPFVPSYRLSVVVPDASTLVRNNDVRIGGVRIGFVESVVPVQDPRTGAVHAKVNVKLDKSVQPLPKDSTVIVRSRSALGLKYLEIDKGTSNQGWPEGSTLPLADARPRPVEIDQVLNTFDAPTRKAIQAKPDFAHAHYDLGLALRRLNRLAEARAEFETALRLNPPDYKAHGNLGFVALEEGDLVAARLHFENALRLNPDDPMARAGLADITNALERISRGK